ncbi:cache domain-containing sensor histidine kinase [Paenibacillus hexagrammi]|uniref:Sensor histidine kinase n=1 Tax=Paenibacillus hexagrammi TaxID=2908839 RepID=A0ABY3SG17_9BACL|nr:sensor histidine kinase [Paenibacillus sp. YPD9-1]UJF32131.1 sensor histidine kinase [Paenibacillus sp. YPD9-1]
MSLLNFFKSEISFKNKLIITFVLVTFLPAIIMQYITYWNSTQVMTAKINDMVHNNLIQTNKNLDTSLSAYSDILYQVFSDDAVIDSIHHMLHGSDPESLLYASRLRSLLASYTYSKEGIRSLSFFNMDGSYIAFDRVTGSSIDTLWNNMKPDSQQNLLQALKGNQQGSVITATEQVMDGSNDGQYVFHIARKMTGLSDGNLEDLGYIVITIDEAVLSQAVNFSAPERGSKQLSSTNFLMDAQHTILSFHDKQNIGKSLSDLMDRQAADLPEMLPLQAVVLKQPSIINYYQNEKTGWTIVNVTNESDLFSEMYTMQKINVITGAVMVIVTTVLIIYFSGLLTKSIRKIVNAMKLAQRGHLNAQIKNDSRDEFSIIISSYNKMMVTINELLEETRVAVQKQKESEIRSLEAQINPHFLYNTLDSINWMAIEKDEHEISRMLKGLAHILRYSISQSNKLVLLTEEIEWLEQYLFLQHNRFNGAFEYVIEMEEGMSRVKLHKLLLQPFIENAILHAFLGKKSGGLLKIRFFFQDSSNICIHIEDNGWGMEEEVVKDLLEGKNRSMKSSGIGVKNVIDRLNLYYGNKAKLSFHSQVGVGTVVSLLLPNE